MSKLYRAVAAAFVNGYNPISASLYREVEKPCTHKKKRIKRDKRKGRYHSPTHPGWDPLPIKVTMIPPDGIAANGGDLSLEFSSDGTFRIT